MHIEVTDEQFTAIVDSGTAEHQARLKSARDRNLSATARQASRRNMDHIVGTQLVLADTLENRKLLYKWTTDYARLPYTLRQDVLDLWDKIHEIDRIKRPTLL